MWDARYTESGQMWSGDPNGALVAEVRGRSPGRALDVGCGEGADAIWLAGQGWDVTALDVSGVALRRAEAAARESGAHVVWLHSDLLSADLPTDGFDLVSAQYPALVRTPGVEEGLALLNAVAPGGTLLFVHHAHFGSQPAGGDRGNGDGREGHEGHGGHEGHRGHEGHEGHGHGGDVPASTPAQDASGERDGAGEHAPGFSPQDFLGPADITALLGDGWRVEVAEVRPRDVQIGAGAGHSEDVVLRAVRLV
jgi:SAM-dependent methyltransferase